MRSRSLFAAVATAIVSATTLPAQAPSGLMADLVRDVTTVRQKLDALARAMPDTTYGWRPGAGVRSVGEVFLHVAAENHYLPSSFGIQPDSASGVDPAVPATLAAFERQALSPQQTVAALDASFAHLLQAMAATPEARLDDEVTLFGQKMTGRAVWILTTTHLHEHLGQAIAYARSNGVVPPWSRSGG